MLNSSQLLVALALSLFLLPAVSLADGPAIPLPADVAKDLELFEKGVVGKPLPTPKLDDLVAWYMGKPSGGEWTYQVVKGKKKHLRVETIKPINDRGGHKAWSQQLGDEYVQYMQTYKDGSLGKYGELDLDLSYGCHFHAGVIVSAGLEPGKPR